jgi:hypothetical protein
MVVAGKFDSSFNSTGNILLLAAPVDAYSFDFQGSS